MNYFPKYVINLEQGWGVSKAVSSDEMSLYLDALLFA